MVVIVAAITRAAIIASKTPTAAAAALTSKRLLELRGHKLCPAIRAASTTAVRVTAAAAAPPAEKDQNTWTGSARDGGALGAAVAVASLGAAAGSAGLFLCHRPTSCHSGPDADSRPDGVMLSGDRTTEHQPRWMSAKKAEEAVRLLHGCFFDDEVEDVRLYDISEEEEAAVETSGSDSTYGEVTCELLEWALERLPLQRQDVIADLGSGGGRALLYLALRTGCDVVGVELSPTRHDAAVALFDLAAPLLRPGQRVQLLKGDILAPSAQQSEATVVLIANRLFSDDFTKKALETTPSAEMVIALREVPGWNEAEGVTAQCGLLPTTWMQRQPVLLLSRR